MLSQLRAAAILLGLLTILLGLLYPAAMTAVAGLAFPDEAGGSIVSRDGRAVGSALIGQSFTQERYLHPRPSAAGDGYDGAASSGTNLAPTSARLADRLKADGEAMSRATGATRLPADAITTSASGLDPDISPAFADLQVERIAQARAISAEAVRRIIAGGTSGRTLGLLGEPRVNVLSVNLALDAAARTAHPDAAPQLSEPAGAATAPAG